MTMTAVRTDDDWCVEVEAPASLPTVVIFPHAGAGPSAYRRLAQEWSSTFRPLIVCLPGRETRLQEPAFRSVFPLIRALAPALLPHLSGRFVLYGHSMGALIAFEFARFTCRAYGLEPEHLVVSSFAAPRTRVPRRVRHRLPDGELWRSVCNLGGVPEPVARDAAMRELLLPAFRADFEVCDTYPYAPHQLLACPITSVSGADDPEVAPEEMLGWGDETSGLYRHVVVPGNHFFNLGPAAPFAQAMPELAAPRLATAESGGAQWPR